MLSFCSVNYKEKCHVKKECNTTVNVITPSLPIHLQRKSKCSTAKCQQADFWRWRGGGSHLFCLVGRQRIPQDWRLQISEYNKAVIMEDIDIIPFSHWQGEGNILLGILFITLCTTYRKVFLCFTFFSSSRWIGWIFWLSYLPLNIKLQSLGNIKQPLPNLKPLDTFLHTEEIQMLGGAFKCQ